MDVSKEIRIELMRGNEPLDWYGGFFLPEDEESLYPPSFDVQKFILGRTPEWKRSELLEQAKIDALRLRREDAEREKNSHENTCLV